jgi:CubicO group peptidase (beta-lactamase class C family)
MCDKKMLKKVMFGALALILAVVAFAVIWVYAKSISRPDAAAHVARTLYVPELGAAADAAEQLLISEYTDHQVPSLSAAVSVRGKLAWAAAVGYADLGALRPAVPDTAYRIGSISKSLTAAATMRLVDAQIIDLDTRFSSYVADFGDGRQTYTIRQLLDHQSGIRHYQDRFRENLSDVEYPTTRDAAVLVQHDPLLFEPGTGFNYSTYGYTVLALALEAADGRMFADLVRDEITAPIGMLHTRIDSAGDDPQGDRASPYLLLGGLLLPAPEVNLSYKQAGGGFLSTPSDIVRFGIALLDTDLISAQSKRVMWTPASIGDGGPSADNYALGFRVAEDEYGRFFHHGGQSVGGYSYFAIYPDAQVVVAVVSNLSPNGETFDRYELGKALLKIFAGPANGAQ